MPLVLIDLENTENTVSRRAAKIVTEDIMLLTGMEGVDLVFQERRGEVNNPANPSNSDDHLRLDTGDRMYVEYTERPNDERFSLLKTMREEPSIFAAKELGIYMAPVCLRTFMEFQFEIRTKSYAKLAKWMNRLRHNLTIRDAGNTHNLMYEYTIPVGVVSYLYDVYQLTENVEGYDRTLREFINQHFSKGLISRQNLSGTEKRLAMNIVKSGTLGFFTDVPEEIETDKERGTCSIQLGYRIEYDKAAFIGLEYQVYIHNQRISNVYADMFRVKHTPQVDDYRGIPQIASYIYDVVGYDHYRFVPFIEVFEDPDDTWHPKRPTADTSTMAIIPIQVDLNDRRAVINIDEISDKPEWVELIPIMEYLGERILRGVRSPLIVELYSVAEEEENLMMDLDDYNNMRSQAVLNPRHRHYVRVAVVNDLSKSLAGLYVLQQRPEMLLTVFRMLDPRVTMEHFDLVGNDTFVTTESVKRVIAQLRTTNDKYKTFYGIHRLWATVQNTTVTAKKE